MNKYDSLSKDEELEPMLVEAELLLALFRRPKRQSKDGAGNQVYIPL